MKTHEFRDQTAQTLQTLKALAYLRSKGKLRDRRVGVLTLCNRAIIARCGTTANDLPPLTIGRI